MSCKNRGNYNSLVNTILFSLNNFNFFEFATTSWASLSHALHKTMGVDNKTVGVEIFCHFSYQRSQFS
jgi:hypothetical protein